jgi:hypothetical protein
MRSPYHPHAFAVIALVLVAGCSGGGGVVTSLEGAVGEIPIFTPASFKELATSMTSDDLADPTKFCTYSWYLMTDSSPAEVEAFYRSKWPGAERVADEDSVTLRNPPLPADDNAPLGESVSVTINLAREEGKTPFTITEDVFRSKRP